MESRRIRYNGEGFSLRGEKGRFILPPEFRKALKESGDGEKVLCLQAHPTLNCVVGFGPSREYDFDAQLDREEEAALRLNREFDRQNRSTLLFSFAKVPFDESGRFIMPERFMGSAKIDDRLFFLAAGPEFLMFCPDELMQLPDANWRHAKLACADRAAQAAARGRK